MLSVLKDPAIAIFLATISPTIAMVAVNTEFFSKKQMRNSMVVVSIIGVICAGLFTAASAYWLTPWFSGLFENPAGMIDLLGCLFALGLFFALSERLFSELIEDRKIRIVTKLAILGVFLLVTWFLSIGVMNGVFALYAVMSVLDLSTNIKKTKIEIADTSESEKTDETESVTFKHKPNIYVLFLESFHSNEVLERIYGIDNKELCARLEGKNFTLYEDIYSNWPMTELSFSNMVWPEMLYNPLHFRDFSRVPSSRIFSAFKDNGYRMNLFSSDYLKSRFSDLFHYSESGSSFGGSTLNRLFAPILAQSSSLRSLFSAADIFENFTDFDSLLSDLEVKIDENKSIPQLHWFHFGAQHTPHTPWDELDYWIEEYGNRYRKAEDELKKTVDMIKRHDANPLIIAVGDHGSKRYKYVYNGVTDDVNELMRSRGCEPELVTKDMSSVFLGIHWPVEHYTEGEVLSHVRLFDHVIAALSEDNGRLDSLMPNVSYFSCPQFKAPVITVRDGAPLDDWEIVSKENELESILEEIEKNPSNVHSHLAYVQNCLKNNKRGQGLEYLAGVVDQFPESEEVRVMLAQLLVDRKEYDIARKHALAAIDINPESGMAYYWLAVIAEEQGQDAKSESFIIKAFECGGSLRIKKDLHLRYAFALMRRGRYAEASEVIGQLDLLDRIAFTETIDWQMQYISFLRGENTELLNWLDASLANMDARQKRLRVFERKLILCMMMESWEEAESAARKVLEYNETHLGAFVALGRSVECQGRVPEALQIYAEALAATKNGVLLEQLGFMAIRNNIHHPDLAQIKAIAREQSKARESGWGKLTSFDEKWYVEKYGHMLGGQSPIEHYMQNSVSLMLNPNKDFDTAFYYTNQTDVFANGVDASLHYNQYGQHELFRPRLTCLIDPSIVPNVNWKSAAA